MFVALTSSEILCRTDKKPLRFNIYDNPYLGTSDSPYSLLNTRKYSHNAFCILLAKEESRSRSFFNNRNGKIQNEPRSKLPKNGGQVCRFYIHS